jgi:hypothetical protein
MKRRGTILVILSLLLGGVAAWGANNWLQERLKPGADPNSSEVAAAAMAIPNDRVAAGERAGWRVPPGQPH